MRRPVILLAIAALAMPCHAQQHEPAEPNPAEAAPAVDAAPATTRDARAPKSLMGMVMGALILSAEQSARSERKAKAQHSTPAAAAAPPARGKASGEQVAVQSEP